MSERRNKYYKQKREEKQSILIKAIDLLSQNKELSFEENEVVRKAEEIKAKRLKISEKMKQNRRKRKATATPGDIEAMRLKNLEIKRQYRQNKREKQDSILQKARELISQNHELSLEENDIVKKAEEIKAKRLKMEKYLKYRKAAATPEDVAAIRLKNSEGMRRFRRNQKAAATPEEMEAVRLKKLEHGRRYRQKRKATATPEEKEARKLKRLEKDRQFRQEKREKEELILKRAMELLNQNQKISLEEKDILRKAEEIEAKRLKVSDYFKQYRTKRISAATSEEVEAMRLKRLDRIGQYRKGKREKEESILKKAMELLKQNREMWFEEKEILRKAEVIRDKRLKLKEYEKQLFQRRKASATPEEKEAKKLKRRHLRQEKREKEGAMLRQAIKLPKHNKEMTTDKLEGLADQLRKNKCGKQNQNKSSSLKETGRASMQEELRFKNVAGWLSEDKDNPNVPLVLDEIKIEEEVIQESTINTIPLRQNPLLGEQLNSSCSWLELSENFMTGGNSQNHTNYISFYGGSSSISGSFAKSNGHSTKINRRKSRLEESFRCMRVLIDVTTKCDGLAAFGKQMAQKLRTSKKDVAEVGIAKQLIDNVLLNLAIGAYNSKTEKIV